MRQPIHKKYDNIAFHNQIIPAENIKTQKIINLFLAMGKVFEISTKTLIHNLSPIKEKKYGNHERN